MAVVRPEIIITQDLPDFFYSYEVVDLVYTITRSVSPVSVATISYVDENGNKVEAYRKESTIHPAKIEDVGSILESYIQSGKREFTLSITSNTTTTLTRLFDVEYMAPHFEMKENLTDFIFSSSLEHVTFSLLGSRNDYSAKFELVYNADVILSEVYIPDANKEITIYDLSSLISPYLQEKLIGDFKIKILASDSTTGEQLVSSEISFTALFAKVDVDMPAHEFRSKYFLSTLMGDKVTALGRKEYLYFIQEITNEKIESGDEVYSLSMQVRAEYVDENFKKTAVVFDWNIELNTLKYQLCTIDVSPDRFKSNELTLVGYTVIAGERKQKYIVDSDCLDTDPSLAFINSFGCIETLYFTGTNELDPSIKRSAAYINGVYQNYYIEEDRNFKANTGVIPESMLCLVDELARSTDTYLIEKGNIGRRITITDSETKRDNDLETLFRASITYRIANRNQNILRPHIPARIFDKTFDKTFG